MRKQPQGARPDGLVKPPPPPAPPPGNVTAAGVSELLAELERLQIEIFPGHRSREQVAAATGYAAGGGGFRNALGRLRTLELIEGREHLTASADLF